MKKDIEWLKKEIEEYLAYEGVRYARIALESVLGYINQLDEPETLSQEWIDDHKVARIDNLRKMTTSDVVTVENLKNLLVPTLSKKKEVQLSQKTADELNRYKELGYSLKNLLVIAGSKQAQEKLARAWLDGYEVEKEKLYTVELPHSYELIKLLHTQTYRIKNYSESGFGDYTNTFTEAEIKAIDKRYWAFAEEVKPCN